MKKLWKKKSLLGHNKASSFVPPTTGGKKLLHQKKLDFKSGALKIILTAGKAPHTCPRI